MEPCLLIAAPQMSDPVFEGTVILLWHHDDQGAIGVVINRPREHRLSELLPSDPYGDADYPAAQLSWGGPVEQDTGTVVARTDAAVQEGSQLPGGIAVSRSRDDLVRLLAKRQPLLLCLGYAGWSAGQLDAEIADGGWLFTDCDPTLVLEAPAEERYAAALATLGLSPKTVWMPPIPE